MNLAITLFYPFDSEFMVRALIAGAILGFSAPLIGTFIVQRKLSLIGDGLGHVGAAGVGIALWLNFAPAWVALIATVLAAISIELVFKASKNPDTALALIFYSGIAASITFAGRSSNQAQLQQFLFGSLLSVTWENIIELSIITMIATSTIFILSRLLLAISVDESSAKIAGIKTSFLRIALMVCVALIVSVSINITGLLLVSAVMVIPVMSAKLVGNSFYRTWYLSSVFGLFGTITGLAISKFLDLAPGGTIVLTHVLVFVVTIFAVSVKTKFKV